MSKAMRDIFSQSFFIPGIINLSTSSYPLSLIQLMITGRSIALPALWYLTRSPQDVRSRRIRISRTNRRHFFNSIRSFQKTDKYYLRLWTISISGITYYIQTHIFIRFLQAEPCRYMGLGSIKHLVVYYHKEYGMQSVFVCFWGQNMFMYCIGIPDNSVFFYCPETDIAGAEYLGYLFDMNDCLYCRQ